LWLLWDILRVRLKWQRIFSDFFQKTKFAVAVGNQRQDDAGRCSRAQEVISHSQFDNGPVLRGKRQLSLSLIYDKIPRKFLIN
jgi:hypothetical protein